MAVVKQLMLGLYSLKSHFNNQSYMTPEFDKIGIYHRTEPAHSLCFFARISLLKSMD